MNVRFLITGVGMMRTSYALGKYLATDKPDLCINAGIAGAFPGKYELGDVVHVIADSIPGLGATDSDGRHLSMRDLNLEEDISTSDELVNVKAAEYHFLPKATGLTVNTVHGNAEEIANIIKRSNADIETMESAAVFYCCIIEDVHFLALRAISNMVEPRDKSKWDIQLAVSNLNIQLVELLDLLSE